MKNIKKFHNKYRVYVSHCDGDIQEYYPKLKEAKARYNEIIKDRRASVDGNPHHPFCYKSKNPVKIKMVNLTVTLGGKYCEPNWSTKKNYIAFHKVPPYFSVSYIDRARRRTKNFRINDTRSIGLTWREAIDFYVTVYPQYEHIKSELYGAMPKVRLIRVHLEDWLWKHYRADL